MTGGFPVQTLRHLAKLVAFLICLGGDPVGEGNSVSTQPCRLVRGTARDPIPTNFRGSATSCWVSLSQNIRISYLRGNAMGSHPINLAIRFLIELSTLLTMGVWGWRQSEGWLWFILAFGIPIIFAVVWGTFAVPNDPSRSGKAPIPVPGIVRLLLELAFFAVGTWALYQMEYQLLSLSFGTIVVVHYLVSYNRVGWLIQQ